MKMTVGNETWFIQPILSTIRYVEYLKRSPRLTFGTTFTQLYNTLSKIYTATSSGNDILFAVQQAKELSWNQLDAIKRFDENEIPDIVDFVTLFINAPNENSGEFDHNQHEAKKQAIHAEGYAVQDFFFLAYNLIENFHEAYQKIQSVGSPKELKDLTLTVNSEPTTPTS
jgi:hypothetical protein